MRNFQMPGRSEVIAANGMCATSHPLAAKVAIQVLEAGGNAVDAAISAALLLGICEPQMTGIGGDCFALIKTGDSDDILALNGSGRAPEKLSAEDIRAAGHAVIPLGEAVSVTVPGAIDAFCKLSNDYGRLGLKALCAPAIHYAEAGIPVAPRVAFDWAQSVSSLKGAAREYFSIDGAAPKAGTLFRAPGQAEVLRRIASEGRQGFYEGEVAEDMVASLRALGGVHTLDDFARTECEYVEPISGPYKDVELVEHPPNGQGAVALLMLNILREFDLSRLDPFGSMRAHIEAEAAKLAYDARDRFIADPDFTARLDHMLSPETAKALAQLIDPTRASENPHAVAEQVHKDTVYVTVVDKDRMAVSLIYSVFKNFGSGLASEKFGINFHNRGAGFTLTAGHPNEAGGGKRPMHTIIPAMLKRQGKVTMPFGVMGGAYQPAGHARFVTNLVDFGLDPQSAIDAPRSFPTPDGLSLEQGYSDQARQELLDMGHSTYVPETPIGGAQSILIDDEAGCLRGASDPRKDGCALGY